MANEAIVDQKKEEEPSPQYDLTVDFIRHGKAVYTTEELKTAQYNGQLNDTGKEQIVSSALRLVGSIDQNNELVIIWSSPKSRAAQSADLINQTLKDEAIPVYKKIIEKDSLIDVFLTPEFLKQRQQTSPQTDWIEFWEILETEETLPPGVETPEQVKQRTNKIFIALAKIARNYHLPDKKRLHFIVVAHEETLRDLLKNSFSGNTEPAKSLENAESLRLGFQKTTDPQMMNINIQFRDLPSKNVNFDINQGKFVYA